jgi:protein-S-isoprenylcysteine O-methyltransferase Ste14
MDAFLNIAAWFFILSGAVAWLLLGAVVLFYFLCQRPPEEEM